MTLSPGIAPMDAAPAGHRPVATSRSPALAVFWIAAVTLAAIRLLAPDLGGHAAVLAATAIFLFGGLPHGAYDITLLARLSRGSLPRMVVLTLVYIAIVGLMILAWRMAPGATLVFFLIAAAFHFGEDWDTLDDPLLRLICGASIAAAPALAHPAEVAAIFADMTHAQAGSAVAAGLFAMAPVILVIASVAIVICWQRGHRDWAAAMTMALAGLLLFPPVIGFALYFVGLHSPRHMAAVRQQLGTSSWPLRLATAVGLPVLAILIWLSANRIAAAPPSADVVSQAFQLLAALTIPHLAISSLIERRMPVIRARPPDVVAPTYCSNGNRDDPSG